MAAKTAVKKKESVVFFVTIDMKWSLKYKVNAPSSAEAREKAFNKMIKQLKKKDFNINADKY
jgi:hypothetical protein